MKLPNFILKPHSSNSLTHSNLMACPFVTHFNARLSLELKCFLCHYSKALLSHSPTVLFFRKLPPIEWKPLQIKEKSLSNTASSSNKTASQVSIKTVVFSCLKTGRTRTDLLHTTPTFLSPLIAVPSRIRFIQCCMQLIIIHVHALPISTYTA